MPTSARIRSGFAARARENASFPSDTTVKVTSSPLKIISTACWMVTESSARSRDLGTLRRLRMDAGQGAFHLYPVLAQAGKLSEFQRSRPSTGGKHGPAMPKKSFFLRPRRSSALRGPAPRHPRQAWKMGLGARGGGPPWGTRRRGAIRPVRGHADRGGAGNVGRRARHEEHAIGRKV